MGKLIIWNGSNPLKLKKAIGSTLWNCGIEYVNKGMNGKIPNMNPGDVLLAMGQKTLDVIQSAGMVAKNRKIGSMRGKEIKLHSGKCSIFFTYDPGLIEIDAGRKPDIEWDTKLAIRKVLTGETEPEIGKYEWVKDYTKEIDYINKAYAKTGRPVDISLDLETVGLDPWGQDVFIVSIAITVKKGTAAVIRFESSTDKNQPARIKTDIKTPKVLKINKPLLAQIIWITTTHKASMKGANLKFDMNWMQRHWGITGYDNYKMDTTLVGSLLDENRSNSLNNHTKTYTEMGGYDDNFNAKHDKSRMDLVPSEDLLPYAGGDTDACLRVGNSLRNHLVKDKALRNFYVNLLHPASKAVQVMEQRGMVVDVAQYEILRHQVQAEIDETSTAFLKSVPPRLKIKYRDNLSPTRAALLNEYLFGKMGLKLKPLMKTAKSGKPSTAMEHMEMLAKEHPEKMNNVIELLRDYNSATKTMSTYIVGFLKHLRTDGKFHPTYMLHKGDYGDSGDAGTVTGRTSAKDPAYQCQPEWSLVLTDKGYRSMGSIIQGLRVGENIAVLSDDGKYHKATIPYDNGLQEIYRLRLSGGQMLDCTGNHPIKVIGRGWVQAQYLKATDKVEVHDAEVQKPRRSKVREIEGFTASRVEITSGLGMFMRMWQKYLCSLREFKFREHNKLWLSLGGGQSYSWSQIQQEDRQGHYDHHLQILGRYENQNPEPKNERLEVLRGAWNNMLYSLVKICKFSGRYGRNASRLFFGEAEREWKLHTGKLHMDTQERAEQKQEKFKSESIVHLEVLHGMFNTYGISVAGTSNYVSDGIVVHNTIPKHTKWAKPLRSVYTVPPGMAILNMDYSQGELRIMACIADEHNMITAYKKGIDMHLVTGASVYGIDFELALAMKKEGNPKIKEIRQGGKAGNFGLIYGISPEGFQVYARKTYGVILSLEDAVRFKDVFFDKNPNILAYHEDQHKFAHKHGHVRSPLGRIRHLPLINSRDRSVVSKQERQSINSPTQGTLSDIGLYSIAQLHKVYPELWVNGFTHDSITAYVDKDKIDIWAYRMAEVMENLPLKKIFGWDHQINFPVDAEVGLHNLGDLQEYEIPLHI